MITIDNDFKVLFSNRLKKYLKEDFYKNEFDRFKNSRMALPIKFLPNEEFCNFILMLCFKNKNYEKGIYRRTFQKI